MQEEIPEEIERGIITQTGTMAEGVSVLPEDMTTTTGIAAVDDVTGTNTINKLYIVV